MPWTVADVDAHKKGLSDKQKRQWVHVANSALKRCQNEGGSDCEGRAIRQANSVTSKSLENDTLDRETLTVTMEAAIAKADDSQRRIWGWVSVAVRKDGVTVIDLQDDIIDIVDLEQAWYEYVAQSGELNYGHDGPIRGHLIEAMVFTPEKLAALGLAPDSVPLGAWAGYQIDAVEDYAVLKQRGYFMFSIEGEAYREEVPS